MNLAEKSITYLALLIGFKELNPLIALIAQRATPLIAVIFSLLTSTLFLYTQRKRPWVMGTLGVASTLVFAWNTRLLTRALW